MLNTTVSPFFITSSQPTCRKHSILSYIFRKRNENGEDLANFVRCVRSSGYFSAHFVSNPFLVKGSVYCDTCRCGYETDATKYMPGCVVRIECHNRDTARVTYTKEVVTDSKGQYTALVESDRGEDYCDAVLVKSSDTECSTPNAGRDRARVILTNNNGMGSTTRYANAMGFLANKALANCPQILKKYVETDE